MAVTDFEPNRVLKLVRNNRILKKVYDKHHPSDNRNDAALKSIFNALIVGDKQLMSLYEQTK
jgi:hypothetical protein